MQRAVKDSLSIRAKSFLPTLCAVFIFFLLIYHHAHAASATDRWAVSVMSYLVSEEAFREADNMKAAGYNAYVTDAKVKGKRYFRLRIGFFATKKEADAQAAQIRTRFKMEDAWVVKVSEAEAMAHAKEAVKPKPTPVQPKAEPQTSALPQAAVTTPEAIAPSALPQIEPVVEAKPATEPAAKSEPVTETKPATATQQPPDEIKPVGPDANGLISVNIYRDFKYIPNGWPMGMSVGQTDAAGLTTVPFEVFKHEPAYTSAKPLYGYLRLGNSNDQMVSFVVDKIERPQWEVYVDKNNNEDLTDDGPAIKNQGTLKMAATVTLEADIVMPDNESRKTPYQLWFFINESGPHFYATCHYAGKIHVGKGVYDAVTFEEFHHDGLFKESGICIDLDRDTKCSREHEVFKDGGTITISGTKYTFRLDYP